jgi:hypothetical protein
MNGTAVLTRLVRSPSPFDRDYMAKQENKKPLYSNFFPFTMGKIKATRAFSFG